MRRQKNFWWRWKTCARYDIVAYTYTAVVYGCTQVVRGIFRVHHPHSSMLRLLQVCFVYFEVHIFLVLDVIYFLLSLPVPLTRLYLIPCFRDNKGKYHSIKKIRMFQVSLLVLSVGFLFSSLSYFNRLRSLSGN